MNGLNDGPRMEREQMRYEIRVRGVLGPTILGAFPDFDARRSARYTVLTGSLPDQAALHAALAQIEALGLELVDAIRLRPRTRDQLEQPSASKSAGSDDYG